MNRRVISINGNIVNVVRGEKPPRIYHMTEASRFRVTKLVDLRLPVVETHKFGYGIWFSYHFNKNPEPRPRTLDGDIIAARMRMIQERTLQPAGSFYTEPLRASLS